MLKCNIIVVRVKVSRNNGSTGCHTKFQLEYFSNGSFRKSVLELYSVQFSVIRCISEIEGATLIINEVNMNARIYKPSKTAMQSGRKGKISRGCEWVLTYARRSAATPDPLMGWQSSSDTARQVRMYFSDLESAIAYAASQNIDYVVQQPNSRRVKPKAYADNFAFSRNGAWTH